MQDADEDAATEDKLARRLFYGIGLTEWQQAILRQRLGYELEGALDRRLESRFRRWLALIERKTMRR